MRKVLFILLIGFSLLFLTNVEKAQASHPICDVFSTGIEADPLYNSYNAAPIVDDASFLTPNDYQILCGGAGQVTWNNILGGARFTNHTNKVNNYTSLADA